MHYICITVDVAEKEDENKLYLEGLQLPGISGAMKNRPHALSS